MCFVCISVQTYYLYRFSLLKESSWKRTVLAMTCIPANIEKCKTRVFVHAMRVEQRGRAERSKVPNGRGGVGSVGPPPEFKKKNRLQMVQSELFWSFICELKKYIYIFYLNFFILFFKSGATPVFPEQLAAM